MGFPRCEEDPVTILVEIRFQPQQPPNKDSRCGPAGWRYHYHDSPWPGSFLPPDNSIVIVDFFEEKKRKKEKFSIFAVIMAKEISPSPSLTDLNTCVSPSAGSHRPTKETTFREWVVQNQIGRSRLRSIPGRSEPES